MVGEEEMVSEEDDGGEELSEAGLVLVRRQQLLQTNLLIRTLLSITLHKICTENATACITKTTTRGKLSRRWPSGFSCTVHQFMRR